MHLSKVLRLSLRLRTLGTALVLGVCMVMLSSAQAASPATTTTPLQSVDYRSSGREYCEGATILRSCLLSLTAAVTGGIPPVHVKWYLSNGTRLRGENIQLAIEYGALIYGVCLSASDATGKSVIGGHWEHGINYGSVIYHTERYAYIRARADISPSCSAVDQPVTFHGTLQCSTNCAPPPILPTWFFGDGTQVNGLLTVTHSYQKQGVHFARLLGTDSFGRTNYSLSAYPVIVVRSFQEQNELQEN
jgi:hypothetical protein